MKNGTRVVIAGVVLLALATGIGIGSYTTPGAPVDGVDRGEVARLEGRVRDLERENAELRRQSEEIDSAPPAVVRKSAKVRGPDEESAPAPGATPVDRAPAGGTSGAGTGAGATGTLRVKVVDENGDPLPGVRVSTKFEQRKESRTNAQGVAEISGLVPGSRFVWVGQGDGSWDRRLNLEPGGTLEVPVTLGKGRSVVEGSVSGRDRTPLSGISIALHQTGKKGGSRTLRTETDAEGRFRFEEVPEGPHNITAYHRTLTERVLMKRLDVPAGGTVAVDFVVGTLSLSGVVRDPDGRPIANARVSAQGAGSQDARTDVNGRYEFKDMMEGKVTVHASADGYGIEFRHRVEITDPAGTLDFVLRRAATLNLLITVGGEPFTGRLYFGIRPAEGTEGTKVGTGITTDAGGRATYQQILPGVYQFRIHTYDRKLGAEIGFTVRAGESTLEVELGP